MIRRFGTKGRPPKGMAPTLTEGVLIKAHQQVAIVDLGTAVVKVHRRQIRDVEAT